MIVILTSNYDGGILQLAEQLHITFKSIVGDTVVFLPDQVDSEENDWIKYRRYSSVVPGSKGYEAVANKINELSPSLVFVCDSNLVTSRIVLALPKSIKVVMCVHDVNPHPNYNALKVFLKETIKSFYIKKAWDRANRIVLFSQHSLKEFTIKYRKFKEKLFVIKLGAHVPNTVSQKPPELIGNEKFVLFFGRIDKYKGIIRLLNAYEKSSSNVSAKLVIAGRGVLTDEEQQIIDNNPNIILIKRYILDGEMIWLFDKCKFTVLPYIEASQSGVLSMSYYFKKPVLVSDLDGLTEFVEENKTGFIFHDLDEFSKLLSYMINEELDMKDKIDNYYKNQLEWDVNVKKCLEE